MLIDKRFFVEKLIGKGGNGRVFRVLDKVSGKILALKQLEIDDYSDEDRFAFEQEFLRLKKIRHPNIIRVHDYGFSEKGYPYFTMDYYPLGNFLDWWKGREDLELFIKLIVDVCAALQYLHEQGILFRDLKPANILIGEKEGEFYAVLSDFGLAHELQSGEAESRAGSFPYISPEAIRNWQLDPRSDLYSLGATIFELLTGRPPFVAEDPRQLLLAHLREKPERMRKFNPIVPFQLDDLVQKLLSKNPESRCHSAAEVVEEINRFKFVKKTYHLPDRLVRFWSGTFIGRGSVLNRLHDMADEIHQKKELRLAIIQGDHGVGKTRMIQEFVTQRQIQGNPVRWISCSDFRDVPNGLILELIRSIGISVPSEEIELTEEEQDFWRFLLIHSEKNWDVSLTFNDLSHFFAVCYTLFEKFARAYEPDLNPPLILVLDDLQEASLQAIQFLRYLAYEGARLPVFLIVDYTRLPSSEAEEIIKGLSDEPFSFFYRVEPLTEYETKALVQSKLKLQTDDNEFYQFVHRYSGGNPLLIEQFLTHLVEQEAVVSTPEGWIWMDRSYPEKTPEGLSELLAMKFQSFTPEQQHLLRVMAVYGESVPHNLLSFYWEEESTGLFELFRQLKASNLLGLSIVDGQKYYRFLQTSWQQFVLNSMPDELRREIHAKWFELIALMREHLESDYLVRATLHALRGRLHDEFLIFAPGAIEYSLKVFDYEQAYFLIQHYLELKKDDFSEEKRRILDNLVRIYEARGDFAAAARTLEDVLARGEDFGLSVTEEFEYTLWWTSVLHKMGETQKAIRELHKWEDRLDKIPQKLKGRYYIEMGWYLRSQGEYDQALKALKSAEKMLAGEGYEIDRALVYNRMGVVYLKRGELEQAGLYLRKSLKIYQDHEDILGEAQVFNNLGILAQKQNELQLAARYYEQCHGKLEATRDFGRLPILLNNLANVYYFQGEWDRALENYRKSLRISQGLGFLENSANVLVNIGRLVFYRGKYQEARDYFMRAIRLFRKIGEVHNLAVAFESLGDLAFAMEKPDLARRYFSRALRMYERYEFHAEKASCLTRMAYLFLTTREMERADQAIQQAFRIAVEHHLERELAKIAILQLKKACLEYNREEMKKAAERLNEYFGHLKDLFEQGLALRHLGWFWYYSERYHRALELAQKSLDLFEHLNIPREKIATLKLLSQISQVRGDELGAISYLRRAASIAEALPIVEEKLRLYRRISELQDHVLSEQMNRVDQQNSLQALQQTSLIVHSIFDLESLLQNVLNMAINMLRADKGAILLMPEHGGELEIKANRELEAATLEDAYRMSKTVIERVGKSGQSILVSNALEDARFRTSESVRKFNIFSLMCVPIVLNERVFGTVYVDSRTPERVFTHRDLEFLENIAELAGVAIGNSEYFHELQEKKEKLESQVETLQAMLQSQMADVKVIGKSKAMARVFQTVAKIVDKDVDVLIRGESGTGKEIIATLIHYNSPRRDKPFIKVNCAAIPQTLLESELFGIEKRVATGVDMHRGKFEQANGGTIFLDEIGDMALETQAKILRVIQEREFQRIGGEETIKVDVRIIAATNKNLEQAIREGKFREDLYYRLNVLPIHIPPLRERKEDIPLLVEHFIKKHHTGGPIKKITAGAMRQLMAYDWPGNVRELENVIRRLLIFSEGREIRVKDLPEEIRSFRSVPEHVRQTYSPEKLLLLQKEYLEKVLADHGWNISKTAAALGIHRNTLSRRIRRFNIKIPRGKVSEVIA
jgi:Nif-specific regulatory protein